MAHRRSTWVVAAFLVFPLALAAWGCTPPAAEPVHESAEAQALANSGEYLFCHWNVENFFDDKLDHRHQKADTEFDAWFANNPEILKLKLAKLTEALLKMNDGRGPDILAICEVESPRAAQLLQQALNARLEPRWHYTEVLAKDLNAGRHIAPAIITRLPVRAGKTTMHGKMQRILEGRVVVGGQELIILATHWTSRLQATSGTGRDHYADTIYSVFREYYRQDPNAAILVCGDFNDTPQDESVVKHLHSTADMAAVKAARGEPVLYNLFADKDAAHGFGTHNYHGKWFIFDQILVSKGMLEGHGWTCDPASAQTFNSLYRPGDAQKRPWRFGEEHEKGQRGYSDHFPVTVKLRVR
jgi:endonuclease/exonuclease/phosphatase family metal-dependent hydrolase